MSAFPNQPILEDTTLRDGEQSPGVAFSPGQKRDIVRRLVEAGVQWIEVGTPVMGGEEEKVLSALARDFQDTKIIAWNRGVRTDVERSLDLGFRAVHIGLPSSDILLRDSVKRDRRWLLETARELIDAAKQRGAYVSISAEDVGRADLDFLVEYASTVEASGADRLRLSDTVGVLTPEGYAEIVTRIAARTRIALQCHCHNDFGLALANLLAGLQAGATFFHTTVNGIGERAGLPDFAQAVMVLQDLYRVPLGIRIEHLLPLSRHMAELVGEAVPPWAPIVGTNAFRHESGIHVNGILNNPATFEPYNPDRIGHSRELIVGKHSGRAGLALVLKEAGATPHPTDLERCLVEVREISSREGRSLSTREVIDLFRKVQTHG